MTAVTVAALITATDAIIGALDQYPSFSKWTGELTEGQHNEVALSIAEALVTTQFPAPTPRVAGLLSVSEACDIASAAGLVRSEKGAWTGCTDLDRFKPLDILLLLPHHDAFATARRAGWRVVNGQHWVGKYSGVGFRGSVSDHDIQDILNQRDI